MQHELNSATLVAKVRFKVLMVKMAVLFCVVFLCGLTGRHTPESTQCCNPEGHCHHSVTSCISNVIIFNELWLVDS
jgi:hypothetical protein